MSRRLTHPGDILNAARWRLRDWSPEQIEAGLALVAGFSEKRARATGAELVKDRKVSEMIAERLVERGVTLQDDEPEVAEALAAVADGRDPWGAFCALLVLHADATGDVALMFSAGFEVLTAYRQAQRASVRRSGNALDRLIIAYLREMPDVAPAVLWADFTLRASAKWARGVFDDYDRETDTLTYAPRPGAESVDIGYAAFRRRVQRLKKIFSQGVRRKPASVAPDPENVPQQPHQIAA